MVAKKQDATLRADPVQAFAIRECLALAAGIAKLDPVTTPKFADTTENFAVVGTPYRIGADEGDFFDFDAIVCAARDLQVAVTCWRKVEFGFCRGRQCAGLGFCRCRTDFAFECCGMMLDEFVEKTLTQCRIDIDAIEPLVDLTK